jgi:hypothetical protein
MRSINAEKLVKMGACPYGVREFRGKYGDRTVRITLKGLQSFNPAHACWLMEEIIFPYLSDHQYDKLMDSIKDKIRDNNGDIQWDKYDDEFIKQSWKVKYGKKKKKKNT